MMVTTQRERCAPSHTMTDNRRQQLIEDEIARLKARARTSIFDLLAADEQAQTRLSTGRGAFTPGELRLVANEKRQHPDEDAAASLLRETHGLEHERRETIRDD